MPEYGFRDRALKRPVTNHKRVDGIVMALNMASWPATRIYKSDSIII